MRDVEVAIPSCRVTYQGAARRVRGGTVLCEESPRLCRDTSPEILGHITCITGYSGVAQLHCTITESRPAHAPRILADPIINGTPIPAPWP